MTKNKLFIYLFFRFLGEKPFECPLCTGQETAFSQLPHLKKHMLTIHGQDKPYLCRYCNSFFKTKADFQGHAENCKSKDDNVQEVAKKDEQKVIKNFLIFLWKNVKTFDFWDFDFWVKNIAICLKKYHKNEPHLCLVTQSFAKLSHNVYLINAHNLLPNVTATYGRFADFIAFFLAVSYIIYKHSWCLKHCIFTELSQIV